jgi:hypothetical protein
MLIERIGIGSDLDPFAAARDHREDGTSGCNHPHIVLKQRHVFIARGFFRERPRQHGADSEEKREPASDINTAVVDSLKALDPDRPIREADIGQRKGTR